MLKVLLSVSGLVFMLALAACEEAPPDGAPPADAPPAAAPDPGAPPQQ
jgi:hypothetical protein